MTTTNTKITWTKLNAVPAVTSESREPTDAEWNRTVTIEVEPERRSTYEIMREDFLKELLALGSSDLGAREWFERALEIGFAEEDTPRSLAELCLEDELANLGE